MSWGGDLHVKKLREAPSNGRCQWLLLRHLSFLSTELGLVVVPAGFMTDFASVPRLPFAYFLAGDTAHASAVVHDYLYRNVACTRKEADKVFHEAMHAEGVPSWRAHLMYFAVRLLGRRRTSGSLITR